MLPWILGLSSVYTSNQLSAHVPWNSNTNFNIFIVYINTEKNTNCTMSTNSFMDADRCLKNDNQSRNKIFCKIKKMIVLITTYCAGTWALYLTRHDTDINLYQARGTHQMHEYTAGAVVAWFGLATMDLEYSTKLEHSCYSVAVKCFSKCKAANEALYMCWNYKIELNRL